MVPMGQQNAAHGDAGGRAVGCGMLLSSGASRAPGSVSSAHVSSGVCVCVENSETLFRSEVCLSLYLDAVPLLNLVSPH